jgi:16S rRNA A1518/A1519 N6-dimethyltransferase RsmA/KsgA/DIM1 with predicted DNA glycosylase/AP lyase activity
LKNIYNICDIKYISNLRESLKKIIDKNKNALKDIEINKYSRIKEILDLLFIQPKKHLKNNLKTYYNKFQSNIFKNEKQLKTNYNKNIDHGQLYLVDCIYQIFEVQEFREEYSSIVKPDKKDEKDKKDDKKEKKDDDADYNLLMDYLANSNKKNDKRLLKILKKKELKDVLDKPGMKLNENDLKNLFTFVSLSEDELLNKIENDFALSDKGNELVCKEEAITDFNTYLNEADENYNSNEIEY